MREQRIFLNERYAVAGSKFAGRHTTGFVDVGHDRKRDRGDTMKQRVAVRGIYDLLKVAVTQEYIVG